MEDFTGLQPEELENLNEKRGTVVEDFCKAVRSKLGNDWGIFIDWKSFSDSIDRSDREWLGFVYERYLPEFTREFGALSGELVQALKGKVSQKLVLLTMGDVPRGDNITVYVTDVVNIQIHKSGLCADYPPDAFITNPATVTLWIEWHFFPARRPPETITLTSEEAGSHGSSGHKLKGITVKCWVCKGSGLNGAGKHKFQCGHCRGTGSVVE